jgi:UDP-N-acetylmuramate--alanine ligase
VKNILEVARNRAKNKLIVLFQPHRFTRTKELWNDFITAFSSNAIDHLIITDIYPASEAPLEGITSENLVMALKQKSHSQNISYIPEHNSFQDVHTLLDTIVNPGDLVLFLGAGKINTLAEKLILV